MKGLFSQSLTYIVVGAALVLIIMNPGGFVPESNSVFSGLATETGLLSGSGYQGGQPYTVGKKKK